jgi:hypothetical protein
MLRAFTNQFPERTVDNDINSPLYLNWESFSSPLINAGRNPGIAFKINPQQGCTINCPFRHLSVHIDESTRYADHSIEGEIQSGNADDVTVTISLKVLEEYPPLDSRWVDKLTVESAASLPISWIDLGAL